MPYIGKPHDVDKELIPHPSYEGLRAGRIGNAEKIAEKSRQDAYAGYGQGYDQGPRL